MTPERLNIIYVSPLPPSPPRFGAQARINGLARKLSSRHDLTVVSLVDDDLDAAECEQAIREYCRRVVLVPNPMGREGLAKRWLQIRSLASPRSFEHHRFRVSALQVALDSLLQRQVFDVVNLEFPYLAHLRLRQSPRGSPRPALVLDAHEIAYDIVHQVSRRAGSLGRRLHAALNWRKLRRDECAAFRMVDGIYACSVADRQAVLAHVPSARTAVIPNAADVDFFQPCSPDLPQAPPTVVFFGLLSSFPNVDGLQFFLREVWPHVLAARPDTRFKMIGARPSRAVQELAGQRVEVTGFVEDLRPHLASAAVLVVPLRVGGGTRLKITEGMAMGRPIVSTSLGAEGIEAVPGLHILIADEPATFAASVVRLLDDPALAARLGHAARQLAVERYSWSAAALDLERFFREIIAAQAAAGEGATT
jgi:glycosyltransferase involved in cell wall biosynthesis